MDFSWYQIIENSDQLQQGDFVPDCPILTPPNSFMVGDMPEIDIKLIDSVILSQSCDLVNDNIEIVLVCPYYSLKLFIEGLPAEQSSTKKAINRTIDNLKKGFLPGYHLLNKYDNCFEDYQVVDFRNVYGIHIDSLKNICSSLNKRIRLLPPYREHLSQSFARYFMRVGLPQDIKVEGY